MVTEQQKQEIRDLHAKAKAWVEKDAEELSRVQRELQCAKDRLGASQAMLEKMENALRLIAELETIH